MLLMANAGVVTATHEAAPETSPRLVAYMLQAFSIAPAGSLPAAPTPRRMYPRSASASTRSPSRQPQELTRPSAPFAVDGGTRHVCLRRDDQAGRAWVSLSQSDPAFRVWMWFIM